MPKPYGFTAKGKIEYFLRQIYPEGATVQQLAEKFEIKSQTVKSYLSEFQLNNIVTCQDDNFYWKPLDQRY
jgi:DNA-binding IclR family transcriptional regulator